jgi:hypothetical protein
MTTEKTLFEKAPTEILDFPWDWSEHLAGYGDGDSVDTATIEIPTAPDDQLEQDRAATVVGDVVTMWLAGGTLGKEYRVTCQVVTANGRTLRRTSTFEIRNR